MTRPCIVREGSSEDERGRHVPSLEERLPARKVAKILGVKVGTLAKWRQLEKGPKNYLYMTPTLVVYPVADVEEFLKERRAYVSKNTKGGDKA